MAQQGLAQYGQIRDLNLNTVSRQITQLCQQTRQNPNKNDCYRLKFSNQPHGNYCVLKVANHDRLMFVV